ncbi:MAG TPA: pyridoxal-phosphate dependent enzyme [Luteimonas sp.]|nr:pyridoxal-phosphate dependent enzyme [Luteimonas sp.]
MDNDFLADPSTLWSDYRPTPLLDLPALARLAGVGRVLVKWEGTRPLGNFKSLGGMFAGLRALARVSGAKTMDALQDYCSSAAIAPRLITASDGNHGLAVAAAARRAGAKASIYLPAGVNPARADRIEAVGGEIVWISGTYDEAVEAAAAAAARGEGWLVPDTSPNPDDVAVADVMAGYSLIAREILVQLPEEAQDAPSHLFVQAGVGTLAAAMAEGLHEHMRAPGRMVAVEPEAAACVARALAAGRPERLPGDLHTAAEMLACGLASASAIEILLRHEARAIAVDDHQMRSATSALRDFGGLDSTPSGTAGLAGLLHVAADPELRRAHRLGPDSCVLLIVSEAAVPD